MRTSSPVSTIPGSTRRGSLGRRPGGRHRRGRLSPGDAWSPAASASSRRCRVRSRCSNTICVRYGLACRCASRARRRAFRCWRWRSRTAPARERISAEIAAALRDDRADAIVLGCAGMADLAASLAAEHGVPVVEGVVAAVKLAETLVSLGLRTSKSRRVGGALAETLCRDIWRPSTVSAASCRPDRLLQADAGPDQAATAVKTSDDA